MMTTTAIPPRPGQIATAMAVSAPTTTSAPSTQGFLGNRLYTAIPPTIDKPDVCGNDSRLLGHRTTGAMHKPRTGIKVFPQW